MHSNASKKIDSSQHVPYGKAVTCTAVEAKVCAYLKVCLVSSKQGSNANKTSVHISRCVLWTAQLCTAMQANRLWVPGGVPCVQQAGQHQPRGGGWTPPQQLPAGALQTPHCPLLPVSSPSAACPVYSSTRGLRYSLQVAACNTIPCTQECRGSKHSLQVTGI